MGLAGVWKNPEQHISNVKNNKSESRGTGDLCPCCVLAGRGFLSLWEDGQCPTPLPETKSIPFSSLVWIPPGDGHGCSTALGDSMVKVCVGRV